ncbi:Microtubule-associated protein 70-2 [Glycine max]|nr:Microtubule-associated protein 70-2 [Glycine max]
MNLLLPLPHHHNHLSFSQSPFLHNPIKPLHFLPNPPARASTIIRMGGGPRTYPGGVSKWVWKRMQAKKAKQLMKARLCRERQIYEMRKRAELKAAVSELERPWEVVEREASASAPNLFSIGADEQVKVLADRFQRPGGFDLWSERDGPVLFESPDELPSARFFPKGVVHSVKPYRRVDGYGLVKDADGDGEMGLLKGNDFGGGLRELGDGGLSGLEDVDRLELEDDDDGECSSSDVSYGSDGGLRRNENGGRFLSDDVGRSSNRGRGQGQSSRNYGRNGADGDGRMRKNGNGRRFLSNNVDRSSGGEQSSPLNYGGDGMNGDGRLRRNGNGRRVLSDEDSSDGERSSHLSYGRNGVDGDGDGGLRRNGRGRRLMSSGDGGQSSRLNYGRNGADGNGRLRRNGNENGRRILSDDDGRSSDGGRSSRVHYGRRNGLNFDGRMRRNENGSKYVVQGVDGADGGESLPHSSSSGRYGASFDGRLRNSGSGRRVLSKDVDGSGDGGLRSKENGRRFMSKNVDGSNGLYSGGASSVRKQRGGNSIGGRSRGKYTNRTSEYASPRGRDANSEVYDMDLQQDGSYGFRKKREQPDSTNELIKVDEKLKAAEALLESKNLEIKKINEEKRAALAAQFAAEATLRRVHAAQKDDEMPPIEAIIAPLEAELKLARMEVAKLQDDNRALDRLTKSKEAALLEAERTVQIALANASLEENKILDKILWQKVAEVEKLTQTVRELEEAVLAGGAAANAVRDYQRKVQEMNEERKILEREVARAKVTANRVATVVANEWKDANDKVMPVKQWLEERKFFSGM